MASEASDPDLTPALKAPPGQTSNLVDPPSHGYVTIVVMVVYLALTTPIVLVLLLAIHGQTDIEQGASVLAWVGLVALASILIKGLDYGSGIDMWNVSEPNAERFHTLFSKTEIVARVSMFFCKAAILLLFLRIFVPPPLPKNLIYYSIWAIFYFNLLYSVALVLAVCLQCVGKKPFGSTCVNTYLLLVTASVINVVSDITIFLIPIAAIWGLHLPRAKKWGLSVVFAVGALTAEQAAGILVGCLPVLPAFFRAYVRPTTLKNSRSGSADRKRIRGDSYLIMKDSKEEVDMESRIGMAVGTDGGWRVGGGEYNSHGDWRTGTTTTINAGKSGDDEGNGGSLSQIESLERDRVAVVSKSVRVDRR
ncbi:MAG: hypothetical protein Q9167_003051 [Letrouitia subvulpina]